MYVSLTTVDLWAALLRLRLSEGRFNRGSWQVGLTSCLLPLVVEAVGVTPWCPGRRGTWTRKVR